MNTKSRGAAKRFWAPLGLRASAAISHPRSFPPQFSRRLRRQPKQRRLLQGAVLRQLPRPHLDAVLDHRARGLPGLQVHRRLQAAQAQLRLRGEAVHSVWERPVTHHVPGEEGGLHWDRSGRIPQYDRGEVCLHDGQCLHSMKSWKTAVVFLQSQPAAEPHGNIIVVFHLGVDVFNGLKQHV